MASPARLALFLDYQNVYMRARQAFGLEQEPHFVGQVNPLKVGKLIAARSTRPARLTSVHVFRGEPSGHHQRQAYAACRKQVATWRSLDPCIKVETRPLRYPSDYPNTPAREKGIDVKIAIDFVHAALNNAADMLVMFSGDTDLLPALEMIFDRSATLGVKAFSAAWTGGPALTLDRAGSWCFRLARNDFDAVRDDTDYR
jgi:NYN domain